MRSSTILANIQGAAITRFHGEGVQERVEYLAGLRVDADGANGQHGLAAAYRIDNRGTEDLRNAGYPAHPEWYRDILVCGADGKPIVHEGGIIHSRTSYRFPAEYPTEAGQYVDAEYFPYVVVPPAIVRRTRGIVMGCRAVVEDTRTGKTVEAVVADLGPAAKIGEGSIALCRELGIAADPRTGGIEKAVVRYVIYPGVAAVVKGVRFELQGA